LAETPKYYWDACAWIALIQQEQGRVDSLSYVIEEAKNGKVQIWTSNFTLAEVFKRPCGDEQKSLLPQQDQMFEDYILQNFVQRVQVDYDVGVLARRILRTYPIIGKPQDGIHLATALLNNIDELHTFDRHNLLGLNDKIDRMDGKKLHICHPPIRPAPPIPEPLPLFKNLENKNDEASKKAAEGGSGGGSPPKG
jgi:predicted nucleic acid-binding protein